MDTPVFYFCSAERPCVLSRSYEWCPALGPGPQVPAYSCHIPASQGNPRETSICFYISNSHISLTCIKKSSIIVNYHFTDTVLNYKELDKKRKALLSQQQNKHLLLCLCYATMGWIRAEINQILEYQYDRSVMTLTARSLRKVTILGLLSMMNGPMASMYISLAPTSTRLARLMRDLATSLSVRQAESWGESCTRLNCLGLTRAGHRSLRNMNPLTTRGFTISLSGHRLATFFWRQPQMCRNILKQNKKLGATYWMQ